MSIFDVQNKKALLVGIQLPKVSPEEFQSSLDELSRLVTTLGYEVVGQLSQKSSSTKKMSVLGEGKLKELASWTGGTGVIAQSFERIKTRLELKQEHQEAMDAMDSEEEAEDEVEESTDSSNEDSSPKEKVGLIVVDTELSPSQLRNLESATGITVLDRTGVIIEIFSRHARTRVARLQVEIAKLTYVAPRLRETGGGADRQGGGIGGKGAGETKLELDRRRIRDRIKLLKDEVASYGNQDDVRRDRREKEATVALVGYTNAGKSSLMRALTGSEVLVADKLFATLDTTIRPLHPETVPKILISDTVGFIKKLPHDLVASFKSTLDEASHASLLLFVVDSSDPSFRSQLEVTRNVLDEVGANDLPSLLVLNKRDRLSAEQIEDLKKEFPEALMISTKDPKDVRFMHETILSHFEKDMVEDDIFVPYSAQKNVGDVRQQTRVLSETHLDQGTVFRVRGRAQTIENLKALFE